MNSAVKISVIVPCYNVEKYVRECLDSVLNQTLRDGVQIVCVNDGSTDGTLAILDEYAQKHPCVEVVNKPNGGLSSARNAGLAHARGEYVQFLDSDDYLDKDALAQLYETAHAGRLDMLFFDGATCFESEAQRQQHQSYTTYYTSRTVVSEAMSGPDLYVALSRGRSFRVSACMYLIRLDFIREKGLSFYEGLYYEDNLFTTQAILQAERAGQLAKPFYQRRMHDESIVTTRKNFSHVRSYMINCLETITFLERQGCSREIVDCTMLRVKTLFSNAKKAYDELPPDEKSQAVSKYAGAPWMEMLLINAGQEYTAPSMYRKLARAQYGEAPYDPEAPFVTVVMPVYNAEKYLHETIGDLLDQSMKNFEMWLVDDGSTDASVNIIESYAAKDPRVKLHRQQNQYAGVARNAGLDLARGEYVIFLDADDRFDPDLLALAYDHGKSNDAEAVIFDADVLLMPKKVIQPRAWLQQSAYLPEGVFPGTQAKDRILGALNPWTKLYKRSYIQQNGFRYQALFSTNDAHFTMMALASASRIVTLPISLVHYRIGETSNIQSTKDRFPLDVFEAFLETKRQMQARGLYDAFAQPLAAKAAESMVRALNSLKTPEARRVLYERLQNGGLEELDIRLLTAQSKPSPSLKKILRYCAIIQEQPFEAYEKQRPRLLPNDVAAEGGTTAPSNNPKDLRAEIDALRNSWAYRIGSRITYLPHRLKSLLRR